MKRDWFCILFLLIFPSLLFSKVIISEVMYNPAGPEHEDEFIEIFNLSEKDSVDLTGWRIGDGKDDDEIVDAGHGLTLLPHQYGLILDPDYFEQSPSSYDFLIAAAALILSINGTTLGSGGLSNSQPETVTLVDRSNNIIDHYTYTLGNEAGYSDERIDLYNVNIDDNWKDSDVFGGTPGFKNSVARYQVDVSVSRVWIEPAYATREDPIQLFTSIVNLGSFSITDSIVVFFNDCDGDSLCSSGKEIERIPLFQEVCSGDSVEISCYWPGALSGYHTVEIHVVLNNDEQPENNRMEKELLIGYVPGDVVINEIMFQPQPDLCEWLEIYNPGSHVINLRDWRISDQDTTEKRLLESHSAQIAPGMFGVIAQDSSLFQFFSFDEKAYIIIKDFPNLNNLSDDVFLYDPLGEVIDQIHYLQDWGNGEGVSIERIQYEISGLDSSNWSPSAAYEGMTPGFKNSVFTEIVSSTETLSVSPNPFSPDGDGFEDVTVISYLVDMTTSTINLRIYDVRGRCIRTLLGAVFSGSQGHVIWDGLDDSGSRARMGIYIVTLEGLNGSMGQVVRGKTTVVVAGSL